MTTPLRPSVLNSMSTPPVTPDSLSTAAKDTRPTGQSFSTLTPPTSPRQIQSLSNLSNIAAAQETPSISKHDHRREPLQPIHTNVRDATMRAAKRSAPECPFDVEILKDQRGRDAMFGTGAWSIVYKGTASTKSGNLSSALTPPSSPTVTAPLLVAVKKPTRRDSTEVLKSEAKILSYLQAMPHNEEYVVPFYGTIDQATIVLAAIPYSLEDHIRKCAVSASENFSTWTMHDPVVGSTAKWLRLAHQLISALAWLHNVAEVVHGDIKPGNILLANVKGSGTEVTFDPVLADFSSAQLLNLEETTPNTLSAVTREFTAPELLSSKVLRDPNSTATTASDVFSLAVTLLVAATGQMLVYGGSVLQRQAMATQGWMVLDHVRGGEQGARVPRMGTVDRALARAVLKADMGRISALDWLDVVEDVVKGEQPRKNT
ncbi:kinase-like domain-containing protein [Exophiala viscosa]|uniref:Kinase-like domain-containing protein n=1 Tax=Exophiala viscosa TaxID=2486360 RepID=A0AAN6DLF2_9EURO|nr:kinase-like domain-containing protein [Exophiala viscosa]